MNVGRRMSHPVISVLPDTQITKAHELMALEKIHRLPVVKNGKLLGIISEQDILKAYPSSVTTLNVWEITSLLEKIKVKDIMTREVMTVQETTPIEVAARMLADYKIGSLPVMRGEELVGIITETDLFRMMLEMLGARHPGVYLTVLTPNRPGEIARLSSAIFEQGGDITALSTFEGDSSSDFMISLKVSGIDQQALQNLVEPLGIRLLDIGTN